MGIYLNDHLAGATVGVALVRRALRENAGTEFEPLLASLADEIAEDRQTLMQTMAQLSIPCSRPKIALAWTAEKLGRLKLNGQFRGYSPLSRLLELEGLASGIEGKRALWLALGQIGDVRLRDMDCGALAVRALSQQERLQPYKLAAARKAFS